MKERPILFSAPMVRAILEGRKIMTRRVMKIQPGEHHWSRLKGYNITHKILDTTDGLQCRFDHAIQDNTEGPIWCKFPFGRVGSRLWVRETWRTALCANDRPPRETNNHGLPFWYEADGSCIWTGATSGGPSFITPGKIRPSIFMPKWASRITLEITGVRMERLNDISDDDAKAEGLSCLSKDGITKKYGIPDRDGLPGNDDCGWHWKDWATNPVEAFKTLWESINGQGSWNKNPFVWVISFKRI